MEEQDAAVGEEFAQTAGARLRRAREAAGLSREDIAARTKIAERHLQAIEEDRLSDLASRTYAVGFSRAFAREVGLDEAEVSEAVRAQLDKEEKSRPRLLAETFEPGDPARVPSARLAWTAAAIGVLAVVVLLALFWPAFLSPQGSLPALLSSGQPGRSPAAAPAKSRPATAGGAVVFTATAPQVWVKFYDIEGNQLFQKEMAQGESYTVPSDAMNPMLHTARPDALAITIGGRPVAKLSDIQQTLKDVPVSAGALLARGKTPAAPVTAATPDNRAPGPPRLAAQPGAPSRAAPRPAATPRRQAGGAGAQQPADASTAQPAADPAPVPGMEAVSTSSAPDSTVSD